MGNLDEEKEQKSSLILHPTTYNEDLPQRDIRVLLGRKNSRWLAKDGN